jgi:hypothetical protein
LQKSSTVPPYFPSIIRRFLSLWSSWLWICQDLSKPRFDETLSLYSLWVTVTAFIDDWSFRISTWESI